MSTNIFLPVGVIGILIGGFIAINQPKTSTQSFHSTSVFSENAEVESEVDPEKPTIEIEENLKPVKGADVEFCTPRHGCLKGKEVKPGVYQPQGDIPKEGRFNVVVNGKSKGLWSTGHKISLGGLRSTKERK